MRSQLRFVMHPDDEFTFMETLLRERETVLIDGPRWKSETPPVTRNVSEIGSHGIIWSPNDLAVLPAKFISSCGDWACRGEHATIQFLRSSIVDSVITEGRLAISTDPLRHDGAGQVERRYKFLSRSIKRTYENAIVRWRNPHLPHPTSTTKRTANPSNLDRSLWVGPFAHRWLADDSSRRIKQDPSFRVEGTVRI